MFRNLIFLVGLMLVATAAGWVAQHPGSLSLEWFGYHIETSAAFLVLLVVSIAAVSWLALKIVYMLFFMPRNFARKRSGLQQERGLQALTDAFVSLSEQDAASAQKYIKEAERLLTNPALPRLLNLQLARQQGDEAALKTQFAALQDSPQTLPLALRGLTEESRRDGRMDEALEQAEKLLKLRPRHKPTLLLLVDLYSHHRRWQEALLVLSRAQKRFVFPSAEVKHLTAVVSFEQAQAMLAEGNRDSAREMLRVAVKKDPALIAAAVLLAQMQLESGKEKSAASVLRRAWEAQPHPAIAEQMEKVHASLTPQKRLQKIRELTQGNARDWESLMAVAKAALAAQDYPLAREQLKLVLGQRETVSLCKLMAELEQAEKKDAAQSKVWLDRATAAFPDTAWQCGDCGHQPQQWTAHCPECRHFDSISWKPPRYAVYALTR